METPEWNSIPWDDLSRTQRRRLQRKVAEGAESWLNERDLFLESKLEPGEVIVARKGTAPLVTDRRILIAGQLPGTAGAGDWEFTPLAFFEITRWTLGRRHDHRPLLRLEHPPLMRMEHVPEHRFLWFEWGDAQAPVPSTTTTLGFGKDAHPVLVAIREGLERANVPRGEPFVIELPGTRQERMEGSRAYFKRAGPGLRARAWLREASDDLYRGRIYWRVRIPSWLLLAVPAWFIEPWLVVPAVLVVEMAWIVARQWSWRRS